MSETPSEKPADPRVTRVEELLAEATNATRPGDPASLGRAVAQAEGALSILIPLAKADPEDLNLRALLSTAFMKRGIALMLHGSADSMVEAQRTFEEAIRIRSSLASAENPGAIFALAAAWSSRAEVLARIGGSTNTAEAIRSYDEAIRFLRGFTGEIPAPVRGRLAFALVNRAVLTEDLEKHGGAVEAARLNREAADLIRGNPAGNEPELSIHLAVALTNLAANLLHASHQPRDPAGAREAAREAAEVAAPFARETPVAAEICIKARRAVCRAVNLLLESAPDSNATRALLDDMTDAADEALALSRHWESKGMQAFRPIAIDLFGLGANLYLRYQPHFLAEFILENLDPGQSADAFRACPQMQTLATRLVSDALAHYERTRIVAVDSHDVDRQLETMRDLRNAAERLAAIGAAAAN